MEKKKSKGAGGKLARSEIIQARLSPKVKFVAEILARLERRTLSSQIETILEKTATNTEVDIQSGEHKGKHKVNLMEFVNGMWHFDEATRFVIYALSFPNLLTEDETALFRKILDAPFFWVHVKEVTVDENLNVMNEEIKPLHSLYGLIRRNLNFMWERLKTRELTEEELNALQHKGELRENTEQYVMKGSASKYDFNSMKKAEKKEFLNDLSAKVSEALKLMETGEDVNDSLLHVSETRDDMSEFNRLFIKER